MKQETIPGVERAPASTRLVSLRQQGDAEVTRGDFCENLSGFFLQRGHKAEFPTSVKSHN